jgi:aldehyde:ferredoxin oxidoreductase
MMDKICNKQGFGEILGSSVQEAKEKVGGNPEEALNIKGLTMGGTNVINWRSRAIGSAVNPRGGDEFRSRYASFDKLGVSKGTGMTSLANPDSWEGKKAMSIVEEAVKETENFSENISIGQFDYTGRGGLAALAHKLSAVSDMLGQCRWNTIMLNMGLGIEFQSEVLSAGRGCKISIDDLLEASSRVAAQERAFVIREGISRNHDTLPKSLFNIKLPGTWPDDELDINKFEKMKDDYYKSMGWDIRTGFPTIKTLQKLNLGDVAMDLEKITPFSNNK